MKNAVVDGVPDAHVGEKAQCQNESAHPLKKDGSLDDAPDKFDDPANFHHVKTLLDKSPLLESDFTAENQGDCNPKGDEAQSADLYQQ